MVQMETEPGETEDKTRDFNLLIMGKMTEDMKFLERLTYDLGGFDTKMIDNIQGVSIVFIRPSIYNQTWP